MTTRKDIRRVIIPARYAQQFDEGKQQAEEVSIKLTDGQYVSRLVCWALDQMSRQQSDSL